MQRKDGTYDLPDEKVSRVWQEEGGAILSMSLPWSTDWSGPYFAGYGTIKPGRWLPWTPPVFPVRVKCKWRLCRVLLLTDDEHDAAQSTPQPMVEKSVADGLAARVAELEEIIATHDLCHDLHGKVGRNEFEEGCRRETVKHFGGCGWAEKIETLTAQLAAAQGEITRLTKWSADLEKSDHLLSKLLSQLDCMEEHIADGKLIGDGKWRINKIVACIVAQQAAWEESRIVDTPTPGET